MFIFIIIISIFYLYISSQNGIVGLVADDAMYLLMADYFSPYHKALGESAAFIMETSQFPPLYPVLLAAVGATSKNILLAHVFTTSCFLGAVSIYVLLIIEDGVNKFTGVCLGLITLFLPASFIMILDLWSEPLYLLLTMCALYLVEKGNINNKNWFVAAFIIALLPLVRTVGITFVLAFLIFLQVNNVPNRYKYILISIVPYFIWQLFSMRFVSPQSYSNVLSFFYQNNFLLVVQNLFSVQLQNLWSGWHECFDIDKNLWSGIVCAGILLLALITWVVRIHNKRIDSFYLLFYLLLIWLWPAPDHDMRFMFVVTPILLYYSYLSLQYFLKFDAAKKVKGIVICASMFIVLATCLPTNLYAFSRLFSQLPSELKAFRYTKYWITQKSNIEAQNSVQILNSMIKSYKIVSNYVTRE